VLPTLFRLGPFTLHTYTVLIDLGIAAGLIWLYLRAPGGRSRRWLDAGLAATVGGFVGARLLYALVNAGYYFDHLGEILQVWLGGLAWPGAVAGGLLGLGLYCARQREPLTPILDALALPLALLGLLGWGGCLAASCAYGYEVAPGELPAWLTAYAPDLYGLSVPRFPTPLVGVAWSLAALAAVGRAAHNRWPAGAHGAYALSLVALGAFGLGFTRGDPMLLLNGYRLDVVGSAVVLVTSSAVWAWLITRARTPAQPTTEPAIHP
jgi:phosphatidylglycerol:prolipoprotein diacylglycerol transferase